MNIPSPDQIKSNLRAYAIQWAIFVIILGVVALLFFFFGDFVGEHKMLCLLAAVITIPAGVLALISRWLVHQKPTKWRSGTGKEIGLDLAISCIGLIFAVPFIFISVTGEIVNVSDAWMTGSLTFLSVLTPALRPRRIIPELSASQDFCKN